MEKKMEIATFAGGCFWCIEAVYKRLLGVKEVSSGYTGGTTKNPSYEEVCTGTTGHAEAIQVTFDTQVISYEVLLDIFWKMHDPTTVNRQGNDIGTQYRSVIFYHCEDQKRKAQESKATVEKSGVYKEHKIVTKIEPITEFYKAQPHHQNYYDRNSEYPYCRYIIDPKIQKLMKDYKEKVKEEYKRE